MAFILNKDGSAASLPACNPCGSGVISISLRRSPLQSGCRSNGFGHRQLWSSTAQRGIRGCVELYLQSQGTGKVSTTWGQCREAGLNQIKRVPLLEELGISWVQSPCKENQLLLLPNLPILSFGQILSPCNCKETSKLRVDRQTISAPHFFLSNKSVFYKLA